MEKFSDYCFRDSFEHSSSESQLIDGGYHSYEATNPSHRSSLSQMPSAQSHVDGRLHLPSTAIPNKQKNSTKSQKFNMVKTFIPTFLLVTTVICVLLIVILETETEFCGSVRSLPEVIYLRYHLYEPVKRFFKNKIAGVFQSF